MGKCFVVYELQVAKNRCFWCKKPFHEDFWGGALQRKGMDMCVGYGRIGGLHCGLCILLSLPLAIGG